MHVTMLRLSFAYAIFTAPRVPAHLFDNTSDNRLRMTPFRVGFENAFFYSNTRSKLHASCSPFAFSVNDPLLVVLLDVCNQRHHLRGLFEPIQTSLQNVFWRRLCWTLSVLEKGLFSKNIWYIHFCDWTGTYSVGKERRTVFNNLCKIFCEEGAIIGIKQWLSDFIQPPRLSVLVIFIGTVGQLSLSILLTIITF